MEVKRIATTRRTNKGYAILIGSGRGNYFLAPDDLRTFNTAVKVEAELKRQASLIGDSLANIFIHINRDGSLAIATGRAPGTWPEDEINIGIGLGDRL